MENKIKMKNKFLVCLILAFALSGTFQQVSAQRRPSKKDQVVVVKPSTVELVYQDLPLEYLTQVEAYIARRKAEQPRVKTVDSKDLRTGFIRNLDTTRQYIHLQLPGETKYTRIQLFETNKRNKLVGMETTVCNNGYCESGIKFYRKDTGTWREVTTDYTPVLDYKYMSSALKSVYKKAFTGLDIYESKGYGNDSTLKNALLYIISPDENKILIQEPHLSTTLYEMIWNVKKQEFDLKKPSK
jgi:hypothetical protein